MDFLKYLRENFLKGKIILDSYNIDEIYDIDEDFYNVLAKFQSNLVIIESLINEINASVEVYACAFKEIIDARKEHTKNIEDDKKKKNVPLSKDEYKIIDLGRALKKCTLYFGKIASSSNTNKKIVNIDQSFSKFNFIDNLVIKQESLIILLTKVKELLSGLPCKTYDAVTIVRENHEKYTQTIRTAGLILDTFLKENNKFLELEEELKQNALALYQKINSSIKSIDYIESGSVKTMLYVVGIPIRELVYLKYLIVLANQKEYTYLDIYPRSRINMHMDAMPFKHYNFLLGKKKSERNIHIVPKEYEREFEMFLETHAA